METMQSRMRAEEERKEIERLRKQREFQSILEEQASLVRERKLKDQVAMTDVEQQINEQNVKEILRDPRRKKELKRLIT